MANSMPNLILKPTFPLDGDRIESRSWILRFRHPLTWIMPAVGALLPFFAGMEPSLGVIGGVLGLIGVGYFWRKRNFVFRSRVVRDLIAESNEQQDRQLAEIVESYRERGMHHYAVALGKFILLKQNIESEVHDGPGGVSAFSEEIENLVDKLCANVCREFEFAAALDEELGHVLTSRSDERLEDLQERRSDVLMAISHSYNTLYETLERVERRMEELEKPEPEPSLELLKEEIAEARKVEAESANTDEVILDSLREEIDWAEEARERFGDTSEADLGRGTVTEEGGSE